MYIREALAQADVQAWMNTDLNKLTKSQLMAFDQQAQNLIYKYGNMGVDRNGFVAEFAPKLRQSYLLQNPTSNNTVSVPTITPDTNTQNLETLSSVGLGDQINNQINSIKQKMNTIINSPYYNGKVNHMNLTGDPETWDLTSPHSDATLIAYQNKIKNLRNMQNSGINNSIRVRARNAIEDQTNNLANTRTQRMIQQRNNPSYLKALG